MIPAGALVIDPVGTAPGVVVPGKPAVVVLPGPPRELQPMWPIAVQTPAVQAAIAGRTIYRQDTVRMFGLAESGLAETLRDAEQRLPDFGSLEITTCLRRGELEIVTRYEPDAAGVYSQLVQLLRERHGQHIYSEDGSKVDDQVAQLLTGRRIATAESCTGGLLAARLTERPGSSAYLAGGLVAYANEAKTELLGVDATLIQAHGAVSEPVAEAMAAGALQRFAADTAVAITGIAGPDGEQRTSRWAQSASPWRWPTAGRRLERFDCLATAPTSGSGPPRWRCICCAERSAVSTAHNAAFSTVGSSSTSCRSGRSYCLMSRCARRPIRCLI